MNLHRRTAALILAFTGVAAACSSATATETPAPAADPVATDVAAVDTGDPKTLDQYLGAAAGFVRGGARGGLGGFGGPQSAGVDEEAAAEQQRMIQQSIQLCMQDQGFEYTPVDTTGAATAFLARSGLGLSPQEYAETEGFGISTRFDALLEGDVDFGSDTTSDPNDDYVASLSEAEAEAYQLALDGQPPERNGQGQLVDPETGEVLQGGPGSRFDGSGCRGAAQTEVRGDLSALAELQSEFEALDQRISADPRIAAIARGWADCMRAAGFSYNSVDEARSDMQDRFRPLLFSLFGRGPGQGTQGGDQDPGGAGGQTRRNPLQAVAGLELTPEQDAELQALQDYEVSAAVASLACQGDTAAEVTEITAGYEAEFVEANRDTLESFGG